jgi:periplasmic protein CpxP/Spy
MKDNRATEKGHPMRLKIFLSTLAVLVFAFPAAANTMKGGGTGLNVKGETVEQRITHLHADLKISPDEEKLWDDVAQAMRDNAARMKKLAAEKMQHRSAMTAKENLETYQEMAQAHVDGLKNLSSSFDALYDAMPDNQKKVADRVFRQLTPPQKSRGS